MGDKPQYPLCNRLVSSRTMNEGEFHSSMFKIVRG